MSKLEHICRQEAARAIGVEGAYEAVQSRSQLAPHAGRRYGGDAIRIKSRKNSTTYNLINYVVVKVENCKCRPVTPDRAIATHDSPNTEAHAPRLICYNLQLINYVVVKVE